MASPEPTPIRRPDLSCVLVEDQTLFLELLSQVLQLQPGLKIVARGQTVAEGLAACKIHKPEFSFPASAAAGSLGGLAILTFAPNSP